MASKRELREERDRWKALYRGAVAEKARAQEGADMAERLAAAERRAREAAAETLTSLGYEWNWALKRWQKKPPEPKLHTVVRAVQADDPATYPAKPSERSWQRATEEAVAHLLKNVEGKDIAWETVKITRERPTDRFASIYSVRVTVRERR